MRYIKPGPSLLSRPSPPHRLWSLKHCPIRFNDKRPRDCISSSVEKRHRAHSQSALAEAQSPLVWTSSSAGPAVPRAPRPRAPVRPRRSLFVRSAPMPAHVQPRGVHRSPVTSLPARFESRARGTPAGAIARRPARRPKRTEKRVGRAPLGRVGKGNGGCRSRRRQPSAFEGMREFDRTLFTWHSWSRTRIPAGRAPR
jgi:hypothetical protein